MNGGSRPRRRRRVGWVFCRPQMRPDGRWPKAKQSYREARLLSGLFREMSEVDRCVAESRHEDLSAMLACGIWLMFVYDDDRMRVADAILAIPEYKLPTYIRTVYRKRTCLHCGHVWRSVLRGPGRPSRCQNPKCKTKHWFRTPEEAKWYVENERRKKLRLKLLRKPARR